MPCARREWEFCGKTCELVTLWSHGSGVVIIDSLSSRVRVDFTALLVMAKR